MVASPASSSLVLDSELAWSALLLHLDGTSDGGGGGGGALLGVHLEGGVGDILHVTHDGEAALWTDVLAQNILKCRISVKIYFKIRCDYVAGICMKTLHNYRPKIFQNSVVKIAGL